MKERNIMAENFSVSIKTGNSDVRTGAPGQTTFTSTRSNDSGFTSDQGFNPGVTVTDRNGDRVARGSVDALEDSDRIVWQGIPVTVEQYLNLGGDPAKIAAAFDKGKPSSAKADSLEGSDVNDGGNADGSDADLDTRHEGMALATADEINSVDTAAQSVALQTGMSFDNVVEMGADVALNGANDEWFQDLHRRTGVSSDALVQQVEGVKQTIARQMQHELGPQAYGELAAAAEASPAVRQTLTKWAVDRLYGRTKVTAKMVADLVKQHRSR